VPSWSRMPVALVGFAMFAGSDPHPTLSLRGRGVRTPLPAREPARRGLRARLGRLRSCSTPQCCRTVKPPSKRDRRKPQWPDKSRSPTRRRQPRNIAELNNSAMFLRVLRGPSCPHHALFPNTLARSWFERPTPSLRRVWRQASRSPTASSPWCSTSDTLVATSSKNRGESFGRERGTGTRGPRVPTPRSGGR